MKAWDVYTQAIITLTNMYFFLWFWLNHVIAHDWYIKILTWLSGVLLIFSLYLVWLCLSLFWKWRDNGVVEKFLILSLKPRSQNFILEFYISNDGYYSCLLIIKKRKTQQQKTNKQKTCRLAAVSIMRSLQTCLFFNVTKMEDVTCSPYCEKAPLMSV